MTSSNSAYHPWKIVAVDLSLFEGRYLSFEIIATECSSGGHYGYAYFDAQCGSSEIAVNSTLTSDSNQVVCASVATLTAPFGFNSYQWSGPNGFTSTNANITTTISGIYTVVISDASLNAPISKIVSVIISSPGEINHSSDSTICNGESAILTAQGMYNCVWNTGDQTPTIFVTPDSTSTYSVTGINTDGCQVSASFTQYVEECAGVKKQKLSTEINFFPNPNSGEFVLILNKAEDETELIIMNTFGQEVHHQNIRETKNTIRIKNPKPGVYFYSVTNNKEVISKGKFKID